MFKLATNIPTGYVGIYIDNGGDSSLVVVNPNEAPVTCKVNYFIPLDKRLPKDFICDEAFKTIKGGEELDIKNLWSKIRSVLGPILPDYTSSEQKSIEDTIKLYNTKATSEVDDAFDFIEDAMVGSIVVEDYSRFDLELDGILKKYKEDKGKAGLLDKIK